MKLWVPGGINTTHHQQHVAKCTDRMICCSCLLVGSVSERIAFARHVRSESQSGQQMKSAEIMDVTPIEVDKALDEAGVARMIHGHTHRPNVHHWQHQGEARERIVLGDWDDTQGWMIRWEKDSAPQLSKFSF